MAGVVEDGRRSAATSDGGDSGSAVQRRRRSCDSDATATDGDLIEDHAPADVIDHSGNWPPTMPSVNPFNTRGTYAYRSIMYSVSV